MYLSDTDIDKIKDFFKDKPAKKVYLFGSFARGDADETSDIDLLVDWDYSKITSGYDVFGWYQDIIVLMKKDVDVVSIDYISPRIEKFIHNDKKLIYERKVG